MRYVEAAGVRLSAIGLGTWQFGSKDWGYGARYADKDAGDILVRALELGVNLIDSAEIYAFGQSERIVGRALAGRRTGAFVATKVLPVVPLSSVVVRRGRASRARLGIDAIDLYQIHWPNPAVPLSQQMGGMRRLLDEGVIRHVGVSNYSLDRWQAAERALGAPVVSNQVQYSLVARGPDRDLVAWAGSHDRIVMAYSPLGQGVLSGRYDETNAPSGVRAHNALVPPDQPAGGGTPPQRPPRNWGRPRRHPRPGGLGLGDPPPERRRHPRCEQRQPARAERGCRRPRTVRRRAVAPDRCVRRVPSHPRRGCRSPIDQAEDAVPPEPRSGRVTAGGFDESYGL